VSESDPKFLAWVRGRKCHFCESVETNPHHLRNNPHSRRFVDKGNVVPLCFKHHREIHDCPAYERLHHELMKIEALILSTRYDTGEE
jgi:hypothetical protein